MDESLKATDRVRWTSGMLQVQAMDPRMTTDEIIDYISEKMTLQHCKEGQHQDRGGQPNWQQGATRQTDADVAETATPAKQDKPRGSGGASDASGGKPQNPYPEIGVQPVDAILAEVYGVESTSQMTTAQNRNEPRRGGIPLLLLCEYIEQHARPDGNGGCYVCYWQNRDHRHYHTRCGVKKREKAHYFQRHPDKVP